MKKLFWLFMGLVALAAVWFLIAVPVVAFYKFCWWAIFVWKF
jgi:hypothetical protein